MSIINILDNLFDTHSSLSVAFSGFGIIFIAYILGRITHFIFKLIKKHFKSTSKAENISSIQSSTTNDIDIIKSSLNKLYPFQEEIYVRYFNKYKKKLDPSEVTLLNEQYEHLRQMIVPNYSILLNKLIGLLEAIDE